MNWPEDPFAELRLLTTDTLLQRAQHVARKDPSEASDELLTMVCALIQRPEPVVFETLVAWCRGHCESDQILGARILGELGVGAKPPLSFRSESINVLTELFTNPKPAVVATAVQALGRLKPDDLTPIISLADYNDSRVRRAVAEALGGREGDDAIDTLIQLSKDDAAIVRDWATFSLGTQCDADSTQIRQALLDRMNDPDDDTRAEALFGLARRHDRRVLVPLLDELKSGNVGSLVVEAAGELAAPELLEVLKELRSWWDVSVPLLEEAIQKCIGPMDSQ